jgi:hypothetical protein
LKRFHLNASMGNLADENAKFRHGVRGEIGKAACSISEYEERILASPSFGWHRTPLLNSRAQ